MCEAEVCRICLRIDTKFYDCEEFSLKKYYEEFTNKSVNKKDGLPQCFCYECATLLHKFHLFKEKCQFGENILRDMVGNDPLTYATRANELHKSLFTNLDILVSNERVKSYHYYHIEEQEEERRQTLKMEIINEEFTEGLFSDDDNYASNDPETDPVDFGVNIDFEGKIDTDQAIAVKTKDEPIETVNQFKINKEIKPVHKKSVDSKQSLKKQLIRKSKKTPIQNRRKPKPNESDSKCDDIEPNKIEMEKTASVMLPVMKKSYKFCKPRGDGIKKAFITSDQWKRFNLSDEEAQAEFLKKAQDKKYLNAPYKCELCYRVFSQKSMLDRHMPQRHSESAGPIECRFCKMRFKASSFVNHLKQHYNKFECLRCGVICCRETSAMLHEEYHSGVKRKCPHCDREFRHMTTFYTHMRTHRSKHMCALCGESFVSQLGLRFHRKAKHLAESNNTVMDIDGATYCEMCKINFESMSAYQIHLAHSALHAQEYKPMDEYLAAEMLKEEKKKEEQEDADTLAKGLVSNKSMAEKEFCAERKSVRGREMRLMGKKPTSCRHCDASFDSISACFRHHLKEHRGKTFHTKRAICEICGASLAVGSMRSHMNLHTRSKMHTCPTCGRSFTTSMILKNHLVTHTGEKNHACTLCDKRFTQSSSLKLHYRTFHLKQPYPKRNRRKTIGKEEDIFTVF